LEVTNPNALLGIKVETTGNETGRNDVTVCNNRIYDVGPTNNLGVTGIIVGNGDHRNIRILDNVIEDLFQNGEFPDSVNGILFDADNNNPGTITDITVLRNTIRDIESTVSPLGIVVQHDVVDLTIEDNEISDHTAANGLGSGSSTTFAQGINIGSQSTTGFEVVGNTIENVVSEDGFFGEDIKIEPTADVSGIDVRENNLLSAIGLNNADGANAEVTAENNYWGSMSGPFVIENNDDDGDVPTPGPGSETDLDMEPASAVTENVDFDPFATSSQ
jgi:hypothetical protein